MEIKGKDLVARIKNHFVNNSQFYLKSIAMASNVIYVTVGLSLGDASSIVSFADINTSGQRIYGKIMSIGKWIIVIKGVIDIIHQMLQGDFETAKKLFLTYLGCFAMMLALPWAMNEVEGVFKQ